MASADVLGGLDPLAVVTDIILANSIHGNGLVNNSYKTDNEHTGCESNAIILSLDI